MPDSIKDLNFNSIFTTGTKLWLKSGAYDKPVIVTLETTDPNQVWVKPVNGEPFLIKLSDVKCVAGSKD